MQMLHRTRLGDMLVTAGIMSDDQLEWALDRQKESYQRLGEVLLEARIVNEDDVTEARALQLDIPYVQLNDFQIRP